jgi:tRNA nucleotidyltransferase (CCA-adding enzyme)
VKEEAAALLMRLRLSNAATDEVAHLAAAPSLPEPDAEPESFRRWLSSTGVGSLNTVARLDLAAARYGSAREPGEVVVSWRRARDVLRERPALTVPDLALDGRGLIGLGLRPGPAFGDILDELLDSVLEDPELNERATLETRALAIVAREAAGDSAPRDDAERNGAPDE